MFLLLFAMFLLRSCYMLCCAAVVALQLIYRSRWALIQREQEVRPPLLGLLNMAFVSWTAWQQGPRVLCSSARVAANAPVGRHILVRQGIAGSRLHFGRAIMSRTGVTSRSKLCAAAETEKWDKLQGKQVLLPPR